MPSSSNSPSIDLQPTAKQPMLRRWADSFKPQIRDQEKATNNVTVERVDEEKDLGAPDIRLEGVETGEHNENGLRRDLRGRHLQMIAFGGSIGTGLFIGSGSALASGGPASLLIDYILIGFMLFNVVMALGELAVVFPISGSFAAYSTRFIDPAWGFAMGWNYAVQWMIVLPLELTAAAITITYWDPDQKISSAVWITIFLLVTVTINLFGVRGYGEAEFVYSMIKVVAVIGFIILGIVINCGGAPQGEYLGVRTWRDPGAFNNGFKGFCSVFVTAAFAFSGTELVGMAAAETSNPRKTLPSATKQVFWRVTIFYVVSLLLIGLIVPYNDPRLLNGTSSVDAKASPFVIAINNAGIKGLDSVFNSVILVSVLSVGNSAVYAASRTLCALAEKGQAPKIFAYIDRGGRPLPSIIVCLVLGLLAYINLSASSTIIFNWLLALSGLSALFTWGSICLAHIRFRIAWKKQGHTLEELPFRAAFGVWGSWFGFLFILLVLIAAFYAALFPVNGSPDPNVFFQSYLAAPVVIVFYLIWKVWKREPYVRIDDIDLVTGRRDPVPLEVLRQEREEEAAKPWYIRFYATLC